MFVLFALVAPPGTLFISFPCHSRENPPKSFSFHVTRQSPDQIWWFLVQSGVQPLWVSPVCLAAANWWSYCWSKKDGKIAVGPVDLEKVYEVKVRPDVNDAFSFCACLAYWTVWSTDVNTFFYKIWVRCSKSQKFETDSTLFQGEFSLYIVLRSLMNCVKKGMILGPVLPYGGDLQVKNSRGHTPKQLAKSRESWRKKCESGNFLHDHPCCQK